MPPAPDTPVPPLPPRLDQSLGYLLAITHGGLRAICEPQLVDSIGGVKQYGVLTALAGLPEAPSQQSLGTLMRIDRTTMVQTVDSLEERGFVVREPNPRDRRERLLTLTAEGRRALQRADRIVARFEDEFLAPLSAGERAELIRLLQTVAARRGQAPRT